MLGGAASGASLLPSQRAVRYEYVYSESSRTTLRAPWGPRGGVEMVRLRFDHVADGGGNAALFIGDEKVDSIFIARTWPTHGTTAGLNCGLDAGAPVSAAYESPFGFTGRNLRVVVELADGDRRDGPAFRTALREQ